MLLGILKFRRKHAHRDRSYGRAEPFADLGDATNDDDNFASSIQALVIIVMTPVVMP